MVACTALPAVHSHGGNTGSVGWVDTAVWGMVLWGQSGAWRVGVGGACCVRGVGLHSRAARRQRADASMV